MDRIAILKVFIDKNPNDMFSRHALALEYIKAGEHKISIDIFEHLLEIDSNYIGSYYHLGKAYECVSDQVKALLVYQTGIDVAMKLNDQHAKRELMAAYAQLQDEMEG